MDKSTSAAVPSSQEEEMNVNEPTTSSESESSDEPSPVAAYSNEDLIALRAQNESLRKTAAEFKQLYTEAQEKLCRNFPNELVADLQSRLETVLNDQQSLGQRVERLEVLMGQVLIANPNIPR